MTELYIILGFILYLVIGAIYDGVYRKRNPGSISHMNALDHKDEANVAFIIFWPLFLMVDISISDCMLTKFSDFIARKK